MGKRSDFDRRERDFYPTPLAPVIALKRWLQPGFRYVEPCAGNGNLIRHLAAIGGVCTWYSDLETGADARNISEIWAIGADYIITNPPWPAVGGRGDPTIEIIERCMSVRTTIVLLSADFAHNGYFAERLERNCWHILSVGRVKWIEGSANIGKDNCAWYVFDRATCRRTEFHNSIVGECDLPICSTPG